MKKAMIETSAMGIHNPVPHLLMKFLACFSYIFNEHAYFISLRSARKNLMGTITHPDVVDKITAGRVMGSLRSAPKQFNILAEFMAWIMKQQGISHLLHYLDHFLILGPPTSNVCQQQLDAVKQVCDALEFH